MKTKKLKIVKRKTLKGGFFWKTKKDEYDECIEELFSILNELNVITSYDKKNMKRFKKLLIHDPDFVDEFNDMEIKNINTVLHLLKKYDYIVYPQIEYLTYAEKRELQEKNDTKRINELELARQRVLQTKQNYRDRRPDIIREYYSVGGFLNSHTIQSDFFYKDGTVKDKYYVPFYTMEKLLDLEDEGFSPDHIETSDTHLKNVKHFKHIMSSKYETDFYKFVQVFNAKENTEMFDRETMIEFLTEHGYGVHHKIEYKINK